MAFKRKNILCPPQKKLFISKQDIASEEVNEIRATVELEGFAVKDFADVSEQNMKSLQLSDKAIHDLEMTEHSTETAFLGVDHQQPRSTSHEQNIDEDTKTGVNRSSAQLHVRNTNRSQRNSRGSVCCRSAATSGLNDRERQTVVDTRDGTPVDSFTQVRGSTPQTELQDKHAKCVHTKEGPYAARSRVLLDGEFNTETKSLRSTEMSPELPGGDLTLELVQVPHNADVTESQILFRGDFNNETFKTKDQTKTYLDLDMTAKVSQERFDGEFTRETVQAPPGVEVCETLLDIHMQQYRELLKVQPRRETEVSLYVKQKAGNAIKSICYPCRE